MNKIDCPDWLPLEIVVEGERFSLSQGQVLSYERQLDLRWGLLSRDVLWRSPAGHPVMLRFKRLLDTRVPFGALP